MSCAGMLVVLRYIASVRVRERARLTRLTKGLPRVTFPFVFLCIKTSAPEGTAGVIAAGGGPTPPSCVTPVGSSS